MRAASQKTIRRFFRDESAGATVEFVAVMPGFMLLTFFVFEIIVAVLMVGTAEKAVQAGARLAVVSDFAAAGLASGTVNPLVSTSYAYGQACNQGACTSFTTRVCTASGSTCSCTGGGACTASAFNAITGRMHNISSLIQSQYDSHTTITYTYVGLGFAGGPIVPSVTVSLSGVPYGTIVTNILGRFFGGSSILTNLPTISVTMTGEDISTSGAS